MVILSQQLANSQGRHHRADLQPHQLHHPEVSVIDFLPPTTSVTTVCHMVHTNMEPLRTTTARLRRTFAYPTDESSSTGTPDALDEEGSVFSPLPSPQSLYPYMLTSHTRFRTRIPHHAPHDSKHVPQRTIQTPPPPPAHPLLDPLPHLPPDPFPSPILPFGLDIPRLDDIPPLYPPTTRDRDTIPRLPLVLLVYFSTWTVRDPLLLGFGFRH